MADRPYTLLSCSMSLDGYLGGATEQRLMLSNDADFDRIDEVRAGCDAILVGAATVRKDNPRLLVRDAPAPPGPRRGRPAHLAGEGDLTARGDLDPRGNFFTAGESEKLVYCSTDAVSSTRGRLGTGRHRHRRRAARRAGCTGSVRTSTPVASAG